MSKFLITGGKKLNGEIQVSGSKNAIMPLMAACLLTEDECVLTNVPEIKDVLVMVEVFKDMGVEAEFSKNTLRIKAQTFSKHEPNKELVAKYRGSILLLGALLGRLGKVIMSYPGGDKIGGRPIDTHVEALKMLNVNAEVNDKITFETSKLKGSKIILSESSVTATENVMLAAALAEGTTTIKLAAMEPHVQSLGNFLVAMGAKISGHGTTTIIIDGVSQLHGAKFEVIPDAEEAASLITLVASAKGDVKISKINPDYLEDFIFKLGKMNVNLEVGPDYVHVHPPKTEYVGTKLQSGLYPKLNSDFMPPMAVLATQARGETVIYEWLYENRLGHIPELVKMGANAEVIDTHRVRIVGPTPLHAKKITSYDLRMGITLVIAALIAEGESEISDIHHIDRGYQNLEQRLVAIGADIKRQD